MARQVIYGLCQGSGYVTGKGLWPITWYSNLNSLMAHVKDKDFGPKDYWIQEVILHSEYIAPEEKTWADAEDLKADYIG